MSSVKETDTHKLWRNIEPHLKKAMQTVYLREVSRSVFIMSLMNHTTFKSNHSFQQFGFCLLWFVLIVVHLLLSSIQSSVGADAANGGEGDRSLERYQHTLSVVALNYAARLQSRC